MVSGLVHQQAARVGLVAVPPAEVVGAVAHVEQPLEVHRADLPDLRQQLLDLLVHRVEAVVEGDRDPLAGAPLRLEDPLAARHVDGHRLLGDDVAPASSPATM